MSAYRGQQQAIKQIHVATPGRAQKVHTLRNPILWDIPGKNRAEKRRKLRSVKAIWIEHRRSL